MPFLFVLLAACTGADPDSDDTDTDETVDTDTAVATVFAAGTVRLDPSWAVDLETGATGDLVGTDLWWEHLDATTRDLRPLAFTRLAPVASEPAGPAACATSALAFDAIDGSGDAFGDLPVGTWLCVHTTEGRFGAVRVAGQDLTGEAQLPAITLDYTLWDPPSIPPPVLYAPVAELAPWLDVRFGWSSDFADTCEIAWYRPDQSVAERVDGPLLPDQDLTLNVRWDEAWGDAIRAVLTCTRDHTGLTAAHTFELTRPTLTEAAPAITAYSGEAVATGDSYTPWSARVTWSSTGVDACTMAFLDPSDGNYWNDSGWLPASSTESFFWETAWGTAIELRLSCVQTATGRFDTESIVLTHE